jgi:peptide deformylase
MKEILQIGNDVLRKKAKKVLISDITSSETQNILSEMKETLAKEEDGVAIAAPQIGYSKRIFVVSPRVFKGEDGEIIDGANMVYINPEITNLSKDKEAMNEGCLSVRWKYGEVKRSLKVSVEAYDENGQKFQRGASGLLAQIFQHETDHLDGVIFIDKADNLKEYKPEDIKK